MRHVAADGGALSMEVNACIVRLLKYVLRISICMEMKLETHSRHLKGAFAGNKAHNFAVVTGVPVTCSQAFSSVRGECKPLRL